MGPVGSLKSPDLYLLYVIGDEVEFEKVEDTHPNSRSKEKAIHVMISEEKLRRKLSRSNDNKTKSPEASKSSSNVNFDKTFKVMLDHNGELLAPEGAVGFHKSCDNNHPGKNNEKPDDLEELQCPKEEFILPDLVRFLRDYDEYSKDLVFDQSHFTCDICFSKKMGKDCLRFKGKQDRWCQWSIRPAIPRVLPIINITRQWSTRPDPQSRQ